MMTLEMRSTVLPLLLVSALLLPASAATPETILYGVSYYHEYMPYERLDRDVEMMSKAGITVVRLGESTWSSWEPRDGQFEFAWMERILDRLHEVGIQVILGTPTYSIPPWLHKKHPDIIVTRFGSAPPLSDLYMPSYPGSVAGGAYGPRQNIDLTNPAYRRHAERIIRAIMGRLKNHPAIIGYQVDNETGPNGLPLPHVQAQFVERLRRTYETPERLNRLWGLAYWGQLVETWDEFPSRDGILNPGYKLEWERFQQEIVTEFLAWQASIVREYARPGQFVTHNFVGGIRTNLDQWAITRAMDIAAVNPYHPWQDRFDGRDIWFSGDVCRSLKLAPYLVTETNAQTIGWDSRAQYPPYDGQLRLAAWAHVAAGANMVAYWHWHSLHYGQETYWKGVLSHDLEPNRAYAEVSRVGEELKRHGRLLAGLRKDNAVAILFSNDSYHALRFMPFSDQADYLTVLRRLWDALYDLNVEPDFVTPESDWKAYKVLLVPPLYSASDTMLAKIAAFVRGGGRVLMHFKSGFADEHSTVRWQIAPGPLREVAGFRYQEFQNLARPVPLTGAPPLGGTQASVWAEYIVPESARTLASYDHPHLSRFAAVTHNRAGTGALTYCGTLLSPEALRALTADTLRDAGIAVQDGEPGIRQRHALTRAGKRVHFYFNFSGETRRVAYAYAGGSEILAGRKLTSGAALTFAPWDVAVVVEE
jgi:beta-galactosidase